MNALQKAAYVLRCLGPGFVATRLRLAARRRFGAERRTYAHRPWDSIRLEELVLPGTPTTVGEYAAFKRAQGVPFLFELGRPPRFEAPAMEAAHLRKPPLAERIRMLEEGRCVYFFNTASPRPIEWHVNALTGQRAEPNRDWFDLPDFEPEQGDVRTLWEPSRAAWAIDLARAAARGEPGDLAGLYRRWLDSWMEANPPFRGPNWKCGQEASVRLIAHALAMWVFGGERDRLQTGPPEEEEGGRWVPFARLAWATGYRVLHHIDYAVSQRNNHAISEACGLILASQLFPEFRDAPTWRRVGRAVMTREVSRQFYADGSYVQHSMNYQRVAMHGAMLALRLCELAGDPLPREVYESVGRGAAFLLAMMDPASGRLPNYGNNDGALVLPLSECDFTDYRPVIQAASLLTTGQRPLPSGPWDEETAWLCAGQPGGQSGKQTGEQAGKQTGEQAGKQIGGLASGRSLHSNGAMNRTAPRSSAFPHGGYYTLRGAESWAMGRCHTYRDRPGQMDALHVDLWWRGQNVLCDTGSYQYFTPRDARLAAHFLSRAAHNTVQIDGVDPATRVSPFLWFPWPRGRLLRHVPKSSDGLRLLACESLDYARRPWRVLHRRTVIGLPDDLWIIVDDLLGSGTHTSVLRWHAMDAPTTFDAAAGTLLLDTPAGPFGLSVVARPAMRAGETAALPGSVRVECARGVNTPERVQGWQSPYYGELRPSPTLEATVRAAGPVRFVTVARPGAPVAAVCEGYEVRVERWRIPVPEDHEKIGLSLSPVSQELHVTP